MAKPRLAFADALAHLLYGKSLRELGAAERAELDALRALDADELDEQHYEQLDAERPEQGWDETRH